MTTFDEQFLVFSNHTFSLHKFHSIWKKHGRTLSRIYIHFLMPQLHISFENIVAKGEIAHNEQFLILTVFSTPFSYYYFIMISIVLPISFQSHLLQTCCIWERVKMVYPFPRTTKLQQMTLTISMHQNGKSLQIMV